MGQNDVKYPFELEIYKGEQVSFNPSHFLPRIEDFICDEASEQFGDWSENWQNKIKEKLEMLNEDFEKFFDNWCEENDCKINFHNVENVICETWIVRSDDDYEEKK